jgi:hypothetical protein
MSNTAAQDSYVSRMTNQSLRSIVLPFAMLGAIWSLTCSISSFQGLSTDRAQHEKRLATFSIVLGSLYAAVTVMLLFGVVAAASKRLVLIRTFAFLSAVVTVILISVGLLRTIVHFMLKNNLISECTSLATGKDVVVVWGFWNTRTHETLTADQAAQFCRDAWKHDSFNEIFWLLAEIVLLPLLTFIAFSYARRESDLLSSSTRTRLPRAYNPAYAAGNDSTLALPVVAYDQQSYAPPPGSPPPFDKSLPSYGAGDVDKKETDSLKTVVGEDPFSDFEEPRR